MSLRFFLLLCLPLWLLPGRVQAFPPSPYYTIFGNIRDESGQILADDSKVLLLRNGAVVQTVNVTGNLVAGQNYELRIPLDMLRPSTTLYRESALVARSGFVIALERNGQRFYPLGVAGNLTSGGGGERERFDFTLGVDSDNDGLPDEWEEYQLISCNIPPGPSGYDLSRLNGTGDFDGDGISDLNEYIQGTFACDGSSTMVIQFEENTSTLTKLKFSTVAGRAYSLQRSTNLITWEAAPMSVGLPGFPAQTFAASETEEVTAWVIPGPESRVFFRLIIQ